MPKIIFYPDNIETEMQRNKTILDIAIQNNVYIPSSCEEGTCSTCMVKVINGKHMLKEGDNTNIKENILACITKLKYDILDNNELIEIFINE